MRKTDIIIIALRKQCEIEKTMVRIRKFYEKIGFSGVFTIDDKYRDFFVSEDFLRERIENKLSDEGNDFIGIVRKNCADIVSTELNETLMNYKMSYVSYIDVVFKDLDSVNLSKYDSMAFVIEKRIVEMKKCFQAEAYLSVIFLSGSVLEAVLDFYVDKYPEIYNKGIQDLIQEIKDKEAGKQSKSFHDIVEILAKPQNKDMTIEMYALLELLNFVDNNKNDSTNDSEVKIKSNLKKYDFAQLISLSYYIGLLPNPNSYCQSNMLREYRNYIHPKKQMSNNGIFEATKTLAESFIKNLALVLADINVKVFENSNY